MIHKDKHYTYWDEGLGSYILTEKGKYLSERDMINVIGKLEHEDKIKKRDHMTRTEENNIMMERIYKELNRYPFPEKIDDIIVDHKTLTLMDISRSLAVIADKLNMGICIKEPSTAWQKED